MPDLQHSFLLLFQSAGFVALIGLPILLYWRISREPLLPASGKWKAPWSGWAVLIAFIGMFILSSLLSIVLEQMGFYRSLYGPDFPTGPGLNEKPSPEQRQAMNLRSLWSQTLAAPVIIALVIIGLNQVFKATPGQIGLSTRRLGANLALGYVGWLIIAPLSFGVFALATMLLQRAPDKHPLMDLGAFAGQLEWTVFALQAAILWPIVEELIFRGVLLAWLIQESKPNNDIIQPQHRSHICIAAAILLTIQSPTLVEDIQARRWSQLLQSLAPFLFVCATLPFYFFLPFSRWVQRRVGFTSPQIIQALFGSSILFAAVHSSVWPTPIPLLVLGLGLGWLAIRTRSIVPSIVVHALFNGVAVIYQRLSGAG